MRYAFFPKSNYQNLKSPSKKFWQAALLRGIKFRFEMVNVNGSMKMKLLDHVV